MGINIGIRHLRAVVAVADAGSYTRAARELGVAQSSLSRTVLEAERRIGVPLFDRTTRRVAPTRDGSELVASARRLLVDLDTTLAHFEGYLAGTRGHVSVATLPSVAATLLPPVLAAFRAARPEVSVAVRDGLSGEVLEQVASGTVDLALTVATDLPAGLVARPVAVDEFACVLPPGDPMLDLDRVAWADLAGRPFVAFDHTSSIRDHTDRALSEHGVALGPLTEARNIGAVAGLTAAGLGVTLAPGLVLPMMRFAGLEWRPLAEPMTRRVQLVQHPDRPLSRTAAELVALLERAPEHDVPLPPMVAWVTHGAPGP